jgi:hypothetical protein
MQDALDHGIPLAIVVDVRGADGARAQPRVELRYYPLSRRYQLAVNGRRRARVRHARLSARRARFVAVEPAVDVRACVAAARIRRARSVRVAGRVAFAGAVRAGVALVFRGDDMVARDALNLLLRRVLPALAVAALLIASLKLAEDAAADNARFAAHYRLVLGAALVAPRRARRRHRPAFVAPARGRAPRHAGRAAEPPPAHAAHRARVAGEPGRLRIRAALPRRNDRQLVQRAPRTGARRRTRTRPRRRRRTPSCGGDIERGSRAPARRHLWTTRKRALDDAIDDLGAIQLAVLGADSRAEAVASSDPSWLDPPIPDSALLLRVRGDHRYAAAEPLGDGLALRVVLPIDEAHVAPDRQRLLQALFPLPARLQPLTRGIERASFDFQRLKFLRGSLKLTFALILTFVLLLSALVVALVAFVVARRLVAPISRPPGARSPRAASIRRCRRRATTSSASSSPRSRR